jgi:hypothetical protein
LNQSNVSVFSRHINHRLNEDIQSAWLKKLGRLVKPIFCLHCEQEQVSSWVTENEWSAGFRKPVYLGWQYL